MRPCAIRSSRPGFCRCTIREITCTRAMRGMKRWRSRSSSVCSSAISGRLLRAEKQVNVAALKRNAAELLDQKAGDAVFADSVFEAALASVKTYKSTDGGTGNYNHFWLADREFDKSDIPEGVQGPPVRVRLSRREPRDGRDPEWTSLPGESGCRSCEGLIPQEDATRHVQAGAHHSVGL